MNNRARLLTTCALLAVGGCSTSTPIGVEGSAGASAQTMAGGGSGGGAGVATPQGPYVPSGDQVLNDQSFTNPSGVSGDWVGYIENYSLYFEGADMLRLHFGVDAQGNNTISLVRGMGAVPPAPTDPYQAWPSPIVEDGGGSGPGIVYPEAPIAGFTYTAHEVTWQGERLRFSVLTTEPWATWCGLQTSYPISSSPGLYGCSAGNVYMGSSNSCVFTDRPQARCQPNHERMCDYVSGFCACNATGCGVSVESQDSYDLTFMGDHATGAFGNFNVMLTPATN